MGVLFSPFVVSGPMPSNLSAKATVAALGEVVGVEVGGGVAHRGGDVAGVERGSCRRRARGGRCFVLAKIDHQRRRAQPIQRCPP